jgi:hypothetical protein
MEAKIVNPLPEYQRVALAEPAPAGYLHIAAVAEPPHGRTPIPRRASPARPARRHSQSRLAPLGPWGQAEPASARQRAHGDGQQRKARRND